MVAFNFRPQFVEAVASRQKRQTIRATPRVRVGQTIQLYTGMRTKACRKIVEADPMCVEVLVVRFFPKGVRVDGVRLLNDWSGLGDFAAADGFASYPDMFAFFENQRPTLDRESPPLWHLIKWDWR